MKQNSCQQCQHLTQLMETSDRLMAQFYNTKDRYDELIRDLIFAIDELVDEDGNSHIDRLDDALHAMKTWLGYTDGRNDVLYDWALRK